MALRERLAPPRGIEAVLWSTRTHDMRRVSLVERLGALRGEVDRLL